MLDCKDDGTVFVDISGAVTGTILGGFAISTFQLLCALRDMMAVCPDYPSSTIQGLNKHTRLEYDGSVWHCQLKVITSDLYILVVRYEKEIF